MEKHLNSFLGQKCRRKNLQGMKVPEDKKTSGQKFQDENSWGRNVL